MMFFPKNDFILVFYNMSYCANLINVIKLDGMILHNGSEFNREAFTNSQY